MSSIQQDLINPKEIFPDTLRFMENSVLEFLQALFGKFPRDNNCYHFEEGDLTEILIVGRDTDNLTEVDTRPKIVVSRGPVSWENRGIANMVGSKNLSGGGRTYADIMSGTVGISCFAREDLEADRIANVAFDSIKMFQHVLKKYGYLEVKSAQVGSRAKIKADARPELYVVPVLVQATLTRNWTVKYQTPVKLKDIKITTTQD
jgi:hypothetical protein